MSLSTALSIAQSSLLNTGKQTSVVSRNMMESKNPDYARRTAVLASSAPGSRVVDIQRAANDQIFRQNLSALSSWSGQNALNIGIERLGLSINGVENVSSPANAIAELQKSLQTYSASPSNRTLAESAVNAARQVVRTLNEGTENIQNLRIETDQQIAGAVGELNSLLAQFQEANKAVVSGTKSGRDVSDALDQRDAILKKIAEYVPISPSVRGDNDMVLVTKDGSMLFETTARSVTFDPSAGYAAGMSGNTVYIDGVPLVMASGGNTDASGSLAGMIQLRDSVSSTMQSQLDEMARGLITAFAESDLTGVGPDAVGLFTWPGAPDIPAAGTLEHGLAGRISLNAAYDPAKGGNPELLRDGGANGADYVANTGNHASFADRLIELGNKMTEPMTFDPAAGISATSSLTTYSSNSIGWFQGVRKEAASAVEAKSALAMRTAEALSNEIGVNDDMEMSLLLELEHTYQASARLIKAVDDMLSSLLDAVR